MPEIDLIPARYRELARLRRWLKLLGGALGLSVVLLLAARLGLGYAIHLESRRVESLRSAHSEAIERRERLQELRAEQAELARRVQILGELRGKVPARQMFHAIDRALDGTIWFRDWQFARAGELVEPAAEGVKRGYFVVVPSGGGAGSEKAWRMQTHMEIRASARDHASLAGFVRRLVAQPEVESVRVLHTEVSRASTEGLVDFELAVVVDGHA